MNIFQIYETYVEDRPVEEQLQLITLISRRIAPLPAVDESDDWTEKDMRDASLASWKRFEEREGSYGEEANAA